MVKCKCENCENGKCGEECPCFKKKAAKKKFKKRAIIAGTSVGVGVAALIAAPLVIAGIAVTSAGLAAGSTTAYILSKRDKSGAVDPTLKSDGATDSISAETAADADAGGDVVAADVNEGNKTVKKNFCSADCKCKCRESEVMTKI